MCVGCLCVSLMFGCCRCVSCVVVRDVCCRLSFVCGCFALNLRCCFVCCSVAGCVCLCVWVCCMAVLLCCLCVIVTTLLLGVFNVMLFACVRDCVCCCVAGLIVCVWFGYWVVVLCCVL